jgi:hypothetical protein
MSEEEEKGFVFKDRRKLGQTETGSEPAPEKKAPPEPPPAAEEKKDSSSTPPLPEVNFSTFIVSLSTETLFHLGEIPHPASGERKKDLPLAKHAIDTLALLQEKTRGNLTEDEQKLLESMLYDLRMCYIRAS